MYLFLIVLDIFLPQCQSLKDKRKIIKSLRDRIKNKFNVSIAEVGFQDKWQRSLYYIALLANEKTNAMSMKDTLLELIEDDGQIEILNVEIQER